MIQKIILKKNFKNEFENDFIIRKMKSIEKINITYQKRNFNQNLFNKQFNIFVSFSSIERDRENKIIENVCYHCDKNDQISSTFRKRNKKNQ